MTWLRRRALKGLLAFYKACLTGFFYKIKMNRYNCAVCHESVAGTYRRKHHRRYHPELPYESR